MEEDVTLGSWVGRSLDWILMRMLETHVNTGYKYMCWNNTWLPHVKQCIVWVLSRCILHAVLRAFAVNWCYTVWIKKTTSAKSTYSISTCLFKSKLQWQQGVQRNPSNFLHSSVLQLLLGDSQTPSGQRIPHLACSALPWSPLLHSYIHSTSKESQQGALFTQSPHC